MSFGVPLVWTRTTVEILHAVFSFAVAVAIATPKHPAITISITTGMKKKYIYESTAKTR